VRCRFASQEVQDRVAHFEHPVHPPDVRRRVRNARCFVPARASSKLVVCRLNRPVWRYYNKQSDLARQRGDEDYVEGRFADSAIASAVATASVIALRAIQGSPPALLLADPFEGQYNVDTDDCVDKIDYGVSNTSYQLALFVATSLCVAHLRLPCLGCARAERASDRERPQLPTVRPSSRCSLRCSNGLALVCFLQHCQRARVPDGARHSRYAVLLSI
jgi:hypothetical protein